MATQTRKRAGRPARDLEPGERVPMSFREQGRGSSYSIALDRRSCRGAESIHAGRR